MSTRRILFIAPTQAVTRIFPDLRDAGIEVGIAENLKGVASFIRKTPPAVIFSRTFLPGYRVEDLLNVGQDDAAFPDVIIMSEKGSAEEAEQYLSLGVKDYWLEPLDVEKILALFSNTAKVATIPPASSTLGGHKPQSNEIKIIGNHQSLQRVLALAKQVAPSKATVLISGDSGTGKEIFSRFLHSHSDRAKGPFIAVNCAALPVHLLESELFGHEKGAFTGAINRKLGRFELAHGGTLLLDEITEMEFSLQAKLLRALQEGEIDRVGGAETVSVDVRVLATTNRDLEDWVKQGKFRQDLFFRLNVIPLRLPSLKERGEDILTLANFFMKMYIKEYKLPPTELSEPAKTWLLNYEWPGNVRELQNLMERATLLCGGKDIASEHFLLDPDNWPIFLEDDSTVKDTSAEASASDIKPSAEHFSGGVVPLHEMERVMIMKGLDQTRGNRTQAANLLGISVRTLRNKLNEYRQHGFTVDGD